MNKLKRYQIHISLIKRSPTFVEHTNGEWMKSKDVLAHDREELRAAFDAGYLYCHNNAGAWVSLTMCNAEFEKFIKTLEANQS